ncbi:Hypothetical predicted protein [Cloeon dipterum]|uniref:protein-tyrosine-phosphatase n=1 Tax=Cloeon dipterum TaxID=197152 RepID=A0A8S1CEE6_9INSE|nr:Hypothetical predicted protein [Cloeon dipterum]
MVTDYRWNDLPVIYTKGSWEGKINFTNHHSFKMHFSILASDSAQFLFTNDSSLNRGFHAVIDGWGSTHRSALKYCTNFTGTYPTSCFAQYQNTSGNSILSASKKWAHATLQISFNATNERFKDSLVLNERVNIHFLPNRAEYGDGNYSVSFKSNDQSLFKQHKYHVLRSLNASSSMKLKLNELSSKFCVNVVYLSTQRSQEMEKLLSLELRDATGKLEFNESITSTNNPSWTTQRFRSNNRTILRNGSTLILTAHVESLVIGGVKFCKEGDLIFKHKIRNPNGCHLLEKTTEEPDTSLLNEKFNSILFTECKAFKGNCSGFELCKNESRECECFAGFQRSEDGSSCTKACQDKQYGILCMNTSTKHCLNDQISNVNGLCLDGCMVGYDPPCESGCKDRNFGVDCSSVSTKKCIEDKINHVDGNCLIGCAEGFLPPQCETVLDYGHNVDGYLYEIRRGAGELKACVTDEPSVAFVYGTSEIKKASTSSYTKVTVKDLSGNAIPQSKYDCNLVIENGCEFWTLNQLDKKLNTENMLDPYPMVTDYRWNDLPVFFTKGGYEEKIIFTSPHNFRMHFSILATDSAQFIFTNDSSFIEGHNAAIDGWGAQHKSLLRYCKKIDEKPSCTGEYEITEANAILSAGTKWAHALLQISFNEVSINSLKILNDMAEIQFYTNKSEVSKDGKYYVSYKTNNNGLFKQHKYRILRSMQASGSMELKLNDSSSSAFCVDVVYLSNKNLHGNATLFSLELKDERGTSKYKESVASKDSFEWTTARFRSGKVSLEKGSTLTLNAHVESLVIGGVKFCKEGDLIFEPIVKNPKSCHSVATKAKNEKQETDEKFNSRLLTLISDCNLFDKNCAGLKVCKNQNNKSCCTCFAGFKGDNCQNRCQGKNFGVKCSSVSAKKCLNDSINHVNGNCSLGCADGFLPPQCENGCQGKHFGINCSRMSTKKCLKDSINHVDGHCLLGCEDGFLPPQCETVLDYHGADEYLFEIRRGGNLEACVSDEPTLAFVPDKIEKNSNSTSVNIKDLNGNAIALSEFDCNLLRKNGCNSWKLTEFELFNGSNSFPIVTDYRWSDLPVAFTKGIFKDKISFTNRHNFRKHFSILAKNSAQFLLTSDSNLKKGNTVVLDGWGGNHSSVLRQCTEIPDYKNIVYPACATPNITIWKNAILSDGKKWVHATLEISFNITDILNSLVLGDTTKIRYFPTSDETKGTEYFVSYRTNDEGFFKQHTYDALRSLKSNSSMEVKLNDSSSSAFCVDVVYLSNKNLHGNATLFSLELKDENGTSKYKESVASKDSFEWTTARFRSGNVSLEKGSTLTLNAHVESLVIGGVKFCKEGDSIFEPIVKKPKSCHSLATKEKVTKPEIDGIFKNHLLLLSECKFIKGNCSGLKLCKNQSENCDCFAGFKGEHCTNPCESMKFGIDCVNTTLKHCFGNKINQSDGNCLEGCAEGYNPLDCEKECNNKYFGKNCSEISGRSCLNDKHFSNNGSCQFGCAQGYAYPECLKEIQKAIPSYKTISFDSIILDLATSLEGKENISHLFIQFKESSKEQWTNASDDYIFNDQANYLVSNLTPKTDYNVRLALFENDTMDYLENFLPGDELNFTTQCRPIDESSCLDVKKVNMTTYSVSLNLSDDVRKGELCSPQLLTVHHDELGCIFNETLDGTDFQKSITDCKCGENKIELTFENATLYQNYACENCPKNAEHNRNIYIPVLTTVLMLVVITASGVGVYFLKRKRSQSPNQVQFSSHVEIIASAEMVPLSIIDQNDESSEKSDQDVEKYLLSALASNVLKKQFEKFPRGQTQHWDYGVKPENKKKNRYGNLAAYDSSRVKLELVPGDENSDYINANYIDGFERPKAYIATQGPRVNTLDDFWRMVWQEKVPLIVMVTNLLEGGKNKCEKYWPDNNQQVTHGRVTVGTVDKEVNADYVSRVLSVSCNNANRLVQHLHYTVWPDHGVPLYPQSMAVFVEKIAEKNYVHPILVHCSAGVGRTGTVILIDACLRMIRTHGRLDVENIFAKMRSQRANLVDNLKQFEFAHLVLLECVATPNFAIGCANFTEEYNKLTSNNNEKLKESYSKLSKMCERDFLRTETPAKNEANKCRYPNFISSSNAIVQLFPYENVVTMSFFNAVTVDGYKKPKQFIATQAPMENTLADFWRMIDQFNVKEIVVLNEPHITETQYLPTKQQKFVFGEIEVILDDDQEYHSVKTSDVTLKKKSVIKKLSVKCASFGWMPGDLSPPNMGSLIDLWDNLKTTGEKECIAIVCHDGVTASGLFLGMGFVIEKIKLEQKVDVGLAVRTLKKSRPAFVSSEIQFGLLYEAAKHYLCSFDTYGNFK